MRMMFTNINLQRAKQMRADGFTLQQIGDAFGVTREAARLALMRKEAKKQGRKRKYDPGVAEHMWLEGCNVMEIARTLRMLPTTVESYLGKAGYGTQSNRCRLCPLRRRNGQEISENDPLQK